MFRPIARVAALLWLSAHVACGDTSPAAVDAGSDLTPIVFRVHVPDTTPAGSHVYIAGDFQGWDPAAPANMLTEVQPFIYEITLSFALHTELAFKITRGSWETVERDARGADIANRRFEVLSATIFDITVGSWADVSPSTIHGDVTTMTVPGFLGRRVWVYLPPGYHESTARYSVLYLLDGQNVFDKVTSFAGEWKVDETLEALIPAGEVAPIIVVAIDNAGSSRIDEYTPWFDPGQNDGGGGAAHLAAIADDLVPYIDASYRTLTGPEHTGFGGSSLGGLMALYAAYARPDVFGDIAAVSPSIWWDNRQIVAFAAMSAKPAVRMWMDMGTAEYDSAITDLHLMRDAMVDQGFVVGDDLDVFEDPGAGHNEAAWSRRFPDVARYLFPPP